MTTLPQPHPPRATQIVSCEPLVLDERTTALLLSTACGKKVCLCFYRLQRLPCDDVAFTLTKMFDDKGSDPSESSYAANLSANTCTCKGHARYQQCKHLTALRQLSERGLLP